MILGGIIQDHRFDPTMEGLRSIYCVVHLPTNIHQLSVEMTEKMLLQQRPTAVPSAAKREVLSVSRVYERQVLQRRMPKESLGEAQKRM